MTSVLESEYFEPERPYSQSELQDMRGRLFKDLRLSPARAAHKKCGHFYHVKQNGKKLKEMNEKNDNDVGNCSVCWKISQTPDLLKKTARSMCAVYQKEFRTEPDEVTFSMMDTENVFYAWLYNEFNKK